MQETNPLSFAFRWKSYLNKIPERDVIKGSSPLGINRELLSPVEKVYRHKQL